jgi:dTDP-4-dehydrorhamnose reductase
MMRILVLGRGYVGTAMERKLSQAYDVTCISKSQVDYTDRSTLFMYLQKQREPFSVVINTCGYTGRPNVDACEDNIEDTWYYNVTVPVNIQKTCKDVGVVLMHVSSGCIYDGYDLDFTEEDEPNFGLLNPKSSWYSKTKHACEMTLKDRDLYIFRLRMPFCGTTSERNILMKLLKYDNIINCKNSLTSLDDFCGFIMYALVDIFEDINKNLPYGLYNVVNPEPVMTSDIIELMKQSGLENKNWKQIELSELYTKTKTQRSNCVLSDAKITKYNLKLPPTTNSLKCCIESIVHSIA